MEPLTRAFNVPPVDVLVLAVRPNNSEGELHGYYEPMEDNRPAHVLIWTRTAQRRQVVAFKTFLRTECVNDFETPVAGSLVSNTAAQPALAITKIP